MADPKPLLASEGGAIVWGYPGIRGLGKGSAIIPARQAMPEMAHNVLCQ